MPPRIKDRTREFVSMCLTNQKHNDFAPTIGILADRGRGKSCYEFILNRLLQSGNPNRSSAFYQSPPSLIDKIKESFPKAFSSRFKVINDIYDTQIDDILNIDEAGNILNGKKALTIEQREFIEGLTFARHRHVPVIWCTTIPGVSKHLRILSEIMIYKRMNSGFVRALIEEGDKFAKKYASVLVKLPIDRALFRANYKYLVNAKGKEIHEGGLVMHKDLYCPWYTEAISQNMSEENMAAERGKQLAAQLELEPFIEEIVRKYGPELKKGYAAKLIKGFILNEKSPQEILALKPYVPDLVARAFQRYHESATTMTIKNPSKTLNIPEVPELSLDAPISFKSFLDAFYRNNLPLHIELSQKTTLERDNIIEILQDWLDGVGQRSLRVDHKIGQNNLTRLFKIFKNGEGVIQDDLRLCYVYEHWIASLTGGKVESGTGKPDILFEIDGKFYPGECKIRDNGQNCQSLDIREKLKPSYEYCLEHKIPCFPVFWRDVKWQGYGPVDYYYTIDIGKSFIANFEPLAVNILTNFNKEAFFLKPRIRKL